MERHFMKIAPIFVDYISHAVAAGWSNLPLVNQLFAKGAGSRPTAIS